MDNWRTQTARVARELFRAIFTCDTSLLWSTVRRLKRRLLPDNEVIFCVSIVSMFWALILITTLSGGRA